MYQYENIFQKFNRRAVVFFCVLTFFSLPESLKGQSVFPFPMWFKDNIHRPSINQEVDRTSDYLTSNSQKKTLRLTESNAIHLVLESNLDVVVDRFEPNLSFYQIEVASQIFEPTISLNLGTDRNDRPLGVEVSADVRSGRRLPQY